jgi:lysophospholipase L1-like esterase
MTRSLTSLLFLLLLSVSALAEVPQPKISDKVLILGDSITYGGHYVAVIEAALMTAKPGEKYQVISCGLSSETVSGLSEPGHAGGQFPRPDVHERLDRVLAKVKPTLVLACYGMNCGIYQPLGEERFKAFREGMTKLHEKVRAVGAEIIHLTPPVFDAEPIRSRVSADGSGDYSKPYAGYDKVLAAYSEWLLEQRAAQGWHVLDIHGPMLAALQKEREKEPSFTYSKDGIHPNAAGHALMAAPVLEAWGLAVPSEALVAAVTPKGLPVAEAELKAAEWDAKARALLAK